MEGDSFEKFINECFVKNGVKVVSIESIVKGKVRLLKIINILKSLKMIRKQMSVDKVIVFDDMILYIFTTFFFKNTFLWLWNTTPKKTIFFIKLYICKLLGCVYSFDTDDCVKYGLKENSQFMFSPNYYDDNICYDLYFVGIDKNRYEILESIYEFCNNKKINALFQLVPDNEKQEYNKSIIVDRFIDYKEVLHNVASSRAILDISKKGQSGPTYRVMEAIFFNKKIVTNNKNYIKLPYYSPDKIFIINSEEKNYDGLDKFILSENIEYDKNIKEYYSIKCWLMRFNI